jgi:hypothetical protein
MTIASLALHSIPSPSASRPACPDPAADKRSAVSAPMGPRVALAPRRRLPVTTHIAVRTDKGRRRADNQDSFLIDPRLGLAVLCDGMGGHLAGARASTLAAKVFRQAISAGRPLLSGYSDRECPETVTKQEIVELLKAAAGPHLAPCMRRASGKRSAPEWARR